MAPRRTELPAKQRNSPGSGPAGPENFGYFPSLESSPPAGGISPKRNRGFAAAAATYFAYSGKVGKTPLGGNGFWEGPAACALVFQEPFPPDPLIYGRARGGRGQSRPARKPYERYLCLLTAVLLNKPDRLLLQGTVRLSGATYTVGSARRAGPFFVCRGRCLIGPRADRGYPPLRNGTF